MLKSDHSCWYADESGIWVPGIRIITVSIFSNEIYLQVMSGEPRYQWEHAILRRDIETRRVVIAYRELVIF